MKSRAATRSIASGSSTLRTAALRVRATHAPFRLAFETAAGESLDVDDAERGMAFAGRATRVWKRLREDEQVYGLGEKTGDLNKRGRYRGGSAYAMWNSDTYAYENDTDPLYVSVPFYIVLRKGRVVADAAPGALCEQTKKPRLEEAVIALLDDTEPA